MCNAGVCGSVCNLTGTFALKVTQQTSWPSNANLRAGSGAHVFWLKMAGTHVGDRVSAMYTECGRSVPAFRASAVNETFDFDLPSSLFDSGSLPSSAGVVSADERRARCDVRAAERGLLDRDPDVQMFDARAERPYAATRLVLSLRGSLSSCSASSGVATVSHIDTGIFGCKIVGNARDCSAGEGSFLDRNCLQYAVGTSTYALLRIADGATCAAVRAALP